MPAFVDDQASLASLGAVAGVATASFRPLRGVMRGFFDALILTGSPVCGLRPMRSGRSTFTNLAKPEIATGSPSATTAVTTSVKPLRTSSTSLRSLSVCFATAFTRSRRFTVPGPPPRDLASIFPHRPHKVLGWSHRGTGPGTARPGPSHLGEPPLGLLGSPAELVDGGLVDAAQAHEEVELAV